MAFPKLIFNDSFAFGDIPLVSLADDPTKFRKSAARLGSSPVVAQWGQIDPIPGHTLVHLLALSDFEKTSANNNGDAFEGYFTKESHPTFVSHGALYKDHKSKGPKFGFVVKSAHNDEMGRTELLVAHEIEKCAEWLGKIERGDPAAYSMGFNCFDAESRVMTRSGYKAIANILPGEEVLTHQGVFRKVLRNIKSLRGDRKMVKIVGQGVGEGFLATEDHQIWAVPCEKVRTSSGHRVKETGADFSPEWIPAGKIRKRDYLVTPATRPNGTVLMDPDVAYMLGQYLGDGHLSKDVDYSVSITTSVDDVDLLAKMVSICLRQKWDFSLSYFDNDWRKACRKPRATGLRIRNPYFADLCRQYCGITKEKFPREEIFNWNEEAVLNFLGGFVDADGSYDPKKHSLRTCSVLDKLDEGIRRLFLSVGIFSSTHKDWFSKREPSERSFANLREYANIQYVAGQGTTRMFGYSLKVKLPKEVERRGQCPFFEYEGKSYVASIVRSVELTDQKPDDVYCLEVEEDHTFTVLGFVVHNCAEDVCSLKECSKVARHREEYCQHVKRGARAPYGMNRILPDGRKCFVFNRKGHFNDISMVPVGADPIAFSLRKVAGLDSGEEVLGGAELAAHFLRDDGAPDVRKLALARKLSMIEKRLEAAGIHSYQRRRRELTPISKEASSQLRRAKPPELFAELAKVGAVLPVHDFFSLIFGDEYPEHEPLIGKVARASRGVFSRLEEDFDRLSRACANSTYDAAPASIRRSSILKSAGLDEYARAFSMDPVVAEQRAFEYAAVAKLAAGEAPESPADARDPQVNYLLDQYAAYKLAALSAFDAGDAALFACALES
jgi:hypothetical protein